MSFVSFSIVFTGGEDSAEDDDNGEEEEEDEELKPLNEMADGETIDVKGGAYRIKRTGDHYYCTWVSVDSIYLKWLSIFGSETLSWGPLLWFWCRCMAWKNQNRPVDSRTCKHLKEHLGEKFETSRCNMGSDAATSSGRGSKSPAKAKAIPQLLLAHKWTERFSLLHTFRKWLIRLSWYFWNTSEQHVWITV